MIAPRKTKVETRFARRSVVGKGVGIDDAVAAAEARISNMQDLARGRICQMVEQMHAAHQPLRDGSEEALHLVRGHADALVGLCGLFGMPEIEKAALSLCKLYEACQPDWPRAEGVCVHLDAIQMFWSQPPDIVALMSPQVLGGLSKVAAAGRRQPAATPASSS